MKKVLLVLLILVIGTLSFAIGKTRKTGGHKAKACTSDKIILKPAPIPNTASDFIRIPFAENGIKLPAITPTIVPNTQYT